MSDFTLSIIIPTYNRPDLLEIALNSIENQETTFSFEVIIQDNSSNSKTEEKIANISKNYSFYLSYEKNQQVLPPIDNWKRAIERASTEIIKILWDDDWLEPSAIQTYMKSMVENNADAVISAAYLVSKNKKYKIYNSNQKDLDAHYVVDSITDLKTRLPLTPSCSIIKKELILQAYSVNKNLINCNKKAMGLDFVMNYIGCFINGKKVIKNNEFLVNLYKSDDSITENSNKFILLGCYVSSAYNLGLNFNFKFSKKQLRNIRMLSYLLNKMNLKCFNYLPAGKISFLYLFNLIQNRISQKIKIYFSSFNIE